MLEKEKRDGVVANKIAESLSFADEAIDAIKRAAQLSKADLTTKMVIEFTELQGVIGEIYALKSGEKDIVYFSLADKIDTIAGLFAIGEIPTGSTDPLALRRSAIGVINIIRNNSWKFDLEE